MSGVTHTPGPWAVSGRTATCIRTADQEQRIAYMETADNTIETCVANARLIAAAPDLLAALKQARQFIDTFTPWEDGAMIVHTLGVIDAAIAKAEARTNA